jgi:glyoxylase I family protein
VTASTFSKAMSMPPVPHLHHVSLAVRDLDVSLAWYRRLLGIDDVVLRRTPTWQRALLRTDGFVLSLTSHAGTAPDDRFDETRVGLDHVSIGCRELADFEAWATHLDTLGIPHAQPTVLPETPPLRLLTCRDPDGIPIEFYLPAAPSASR